MPRAPEYPKGAVHSKAGPMTVPSSLAKGHCLLLFDLFLLFSPSSSLLPPPFEIGLTTEPRLVSSSGFSYFNLPSARIADMSHHACRDSFLASP